MCLPLLIDLDGVLRIGKLPAPGIREFLDFIRSSGVNACILSNCSLSTGEHVRGFFKENSITCNIPIITAADAAFEFVSSKYSRVLAVVSDSVKHLFDGLIDEINPEAIVIGKKWDYNIMLDIFNRLRGGADLIALHKNKFWISPENELLLDAGPFITALEYATGKQAKLIGKPSPHYFQSALHKLGFDSSQKFLMLGDDLETDIYGAQSVGSIAVLIYTGKTKHPIPSESTVKPDYIAADLRETIYLLEKMILDKVK
ncbi:MAG: HAD hydrolase-like protein [bacterium]